MAGAHVKVRLDTSKAKKDLNEMAKQGEAAAGRINRGVKGEAGGGSNLAKGFGLGAGFALGKKVAGAVGVFSAIGDITGQFFSGISADIDAKMFDGAAIDARASKGARDQTVQDFALQAYYSGSTFQAKQFYNTIRKAKYLPEQQGASDINRAIGGSRGTRGAKGEDPLEEMLTSIVDAIGAGFTSITKLLGG